MSIRAAFTLSAYALVLTGILSLSIAEGSPAIIVTASVLSVMGYYRAEHLGRPVGRVGTNLLVALVVALVPADYVLVTGDPLLSMAHFLLAVQVVKLFGKKTARDYLQLFTVSLMHLGVSAVLTIELAFSIAFLTYMVVGTWTLVLFLLVRELDSRTPEDAGTVRSARGLFGGTALISVGTLALTLVFFFAFPRFSAVLFDVKRRTETQRISGFTDEIGLTALSDIKENTAVVMRVHVDDLGERFPVEPKWRGLAFDVYEKGTWKRSWPRPETSPRAIVEARSERTESGQRWLIHPGRPAPAPGEKAVYTVWLEPLGLDSNTLFGVPDVRSVEFLSQDRASPILADAGDAVIGVGLPPAEVKYRAESVPVGREAARAVRAVRETRPGGIDYLRLPPGDLGPKLGARAREVVERAGAETPYEKAAALERYLVGDFRYTLDLGELEPPPAGVDPIEHFVFTTHAGHCELSASAFVLMCRTLGLPARLVNGFQTGQWNDISGYYQVRQMEAHAWAEVYFGPEAGWVDFDPTPWSSGGTGLTVFEKIQDYLRLRWLNYVISYNLSDQISLAERLRARVEGLRQELRKAFRDLRHSLPRLKGRELARILFAVAGLAGLAVGVVWVVLARRRSNGKRPPPRPRRARPVPFYEELLRILERRGFRRRPAETAREFARRVVREGGAGLGGVPAVAEAFYRVRFGGADLEPEESRRVEAALGALAGAPPAA